MALISIVIPAFNEQECVPQMVQRLTALPLGEDRLEMIFVDDGSSDRTLEILRGLAAADARVRYVSFSRNFGHEAALTAGLDHAMGDAVVTLDGDLQHPPELIPQLLARWREGCQIVYARRQTSESLPWLKAATSRLFYKAIRYSSPVDIPPDTANFRLMDRRAVEQFRRLREHSRFGRALVAWTGFKTATVPYEEDKRFAGATKYNMWKSAKLAVDAFISFTNLPLVLSLWIGAAFVGVSLLILLAKIIDRIAYGEYFMTAGMLVAFMFFIGGVILMMLGIVGAYVLRIYQEAQNRPLYIVAEKSASLPPGQQGASHE